MGPSVVLLHGIRTSASMWRAQTEALADAGITARAVDLPGHGTRIGESFSLGGALDAVDAAVDGLPGPVILCGLSLGGYLALHWTAERGAGRIDGLIAAACGTTPRGAPLTGYRGIADLIHRLPDRGSRLNQFMIDRFIPDPVARDDVVSGGVALDVMADGLRAMASVRPLSAIGRVRVPILFVNGRFDHFRLEERRYLQAALNRPGLPPSWSQLAIVPRASHLVSLTRPQEFTRILVTAAQAAADRV
jgi:pimeloyl-ACP methyl ester carboxylesterase